MNPINELSFASGAILVSGIVFGGLVLKDTAVAAVGITTKVHAFVLKELFFQFHRFNRPISILPLPTIEDLARFEYEKHIVSQLDDFGDSWIKSAKESMPINLLGAVVSMLGICFIANQASQMPGSLNGTHSFNATLWNSTTNTTI